MRKTVLLFLFFIGNIHFFGQSKIDEAETFFNQRAFAKAIPIYQTIAKSNPSKKIYFQLAKAYTEQRDFTNALDAAQKALEMGSLDENEKLIYFNALKNMGLYEDAKDFVRQQFSATYQRKQLASIDSIQKWTTIPPKYSIRNLEINSPLNDFALAPLTEGQYLFTSDRVSAGKNATTNPLYEFNNQPYLNLYKVSMEKNGQLKSTDIVNYMDKSPNYHGGTAYYDALSNKIYITRNYIKNEKLLGDQNNKSNLEIIIADLNDKMEITKTTDFPYNNPSYSVGHPCLSADAKTLYFISDQPGGKGGTDIYYCEKDKDGKWGMPKNMGNTINTSSNEMFPYVSTKGDLYFASEGHIGFGGLDIFCAKQIRENDFGKPVNMGQTINSSYDDFSLFFNDFKQLSGFLSSNRPGGNGGDDIYYFDRIGDIEPKVERENFTVKLIDAESKDILINGRLQLINLSTGDSISKWTNEYGFAKFRVDSTNRYLLRASMNQYLSNEFDDLDPKKTSYTAPLNKKVLNKAIVIRNIYYEFDKADIHPNAMENLNKLAILLNQNPDVKIELSSHTDSRGKDEYNLNLSQKRAESVVKYLINKGVYPNRMIARGYGEYQLMNGCKNNVPCSEEDHVQNRRTEFKIIDIQNDKVISSQSDESLARNLTLQKSYEAVSPATKVNSIDAIENTNIAAKYNSSSAIKPMQNVESNANSSTNYYAVQLGAFSKPSSSLDQLYDLGTIQYLEDNNRYIAIKGGFQTIQQARQYKESIHHIVKDAYVILIENGHKMPISK